MNPINNLVYKGNIMDKWEKPSNEIITIFDLFFDGMPTSVRLINTSRGDKDFRETAIMETASGERFVIKLADNDFTFPEKIGMWQRTVEEYIALGYYCPKIVCDKRGGFPTVNYKRRRCFAYAEEYAKYSPLEERDSDESVNICHVYDKYRKDIWRMTARIASKHLDYTSYPSGYCLFGTFSPGDEVDEVFEEALKWKQYAGTLPYEFREQVQRIWELWTANRAALEKVYGELPTSVFQADLNSTNILVDENERFVGIYDFNLCGKDVFLNYLMRENFHADFEKEIGMICEMLKTAAGYYRFSDIEKDSALMLYRCLKPLWCNKLERLKALKDNDAIKNFLDKTEYCLTEDIDFKTCMKHI